MNPYENYYINQAGSGIVTYSGNRYQKGNGFFGRLISGFAMPLLRYFGRQGLETLGNVVADIKENPDEQIKDVLKRQVKKTLVNTTTDGADRVKKFIQTGKGISSNKYKSKTLKRSASIARVTPVKKRKCKADSFLL